MKKDLVAIPFYCDNIEKIRALVVTIASVRDCMNYKNTDVIIILTNLSKDTQAEFDELVNPNVEKVLVCKNNLAMAWNLGIKYGIEGDYENIFLANDDIVIRRDCLEILKLHKQHASSYVMIWKARATDARYIDNNFDLWRKDLHGVHKEIGYSLFLINNELPEEVGYFDEQYEPIYFEDKDMEKQITAKKCLSDGVLTAEYWHLGSLTFNTTKTLDTNKIYKDNEIKFNKKWNIKEK